MKLRTQILVLLLAIGLPLVAANAWWMAAQQRREHARALARLRHEAEQAAYTLGRFLADLASRGREIAQSRSTGEAGRSLREPRAALRAWNPGILGLAWIDPPDGASARRALPDRGFVGWGAARPPAWTVEGLGATGGAVEAVLRVPGAAPGGMRPPPGLLAIRFGAEALRTLFPMDRPWSRLRVTDRAGGLVFATGGARPGPDSPDDWGNAPGLGEARAVGVATVREARLAAGGPPALWMLAHVPLGQTGWVVSALIPAAEALADSRRVLVGEVLLQVSLVLACAAAALVLAHRAAQPARRLAAAAQRIAGGDRTARVGLPGQSELAAAGRAFDEMAQALDASWEALRRQRDAAERVAARLATLSRLAAMTSASLDPSRVFDFIAEATSHLLDGAVVLLLVGDDEGGPVRLRASCGARRPELRTQAEYRPGEGLVGWVLQHREPLVLPDILADGRTRNRAWLTAEGLRAFAGVPLLVGPDCLGVLYAARDADRPFEAEDVELLTSFAAHAAVAIRNARLYAWAAQEATVKGILLDELHHRVRNNLALIIGFLELQRTTPDGARAAAVLDEAVARVKGLALVHTILTEAGSRPGQVDSLVRRLAEQTLLQGPLEGRVRLALDLQPLSLPPRELMALGILTNELFTNIAKHAFPDGRTGTVQVGLVRSGREITLRVRDDGVALPPRGGAGEDRLGLRLVRSLVEASLRGRLWIEGEAGTALVIRFPVPEGEPGEAARRVTRREGWQAA